MADEAEQDRQRADALTALVNADEPPINKFITRPTEVKPAKAKAPAKPKKPEYKPFKW